MISAPWRIRARLRWTWGGRRLLARAGLRAYTVSWWLMVLSALCAALSLGWSATQAASPASSVLAALMGAALTRLMLLGAQLSSPAPGPAESVAMILRGARRSRQAQLLGAGLGVLIAVAWAAGAPTDLGELLSALSLMALMGAGACAELGLGLRGLCGDEPPRRRGARQKRAEPTLAPVRVHSRKR